MRHRNHRSQLNRTTSHRRCLVANMLKSLILEGRIVTTVAKAKVLRGYADKMVTLAKKNTLATRRRAIQQLMVRYNPLTAKEKKAAKQGDTSAYNGDRLVIDKLFTEIGPRFTAREGGYTRLVKGPTRVGDNSQTCIIEYLSE